MQIGTKSIYPKAFANHLVMRAHSKKKTRRSILIALSLTSMVDMFSLLVIFLLQTFSASPELLLVTKGVQLPVAISGKQIMDAPVLSVSSAEVFLDQKLVGTTSDVLRNPEPLMEKLRDLRELSQKTHPGEKFKGEMNLQAHKETSSTVVSQVMGLLSGQGYGSIQLVVTSAN